MKNIVLIDRGLMLLDSVYSSNKVNIKYLIADYDAQVEKLKEAYDIENVFAATDSLNEHLAQAEIDIDYDLIEKFKATQLKSEHFHDRFSDDTNLIQYYYFCALSFWHQVFSTEDISAVVLRGVEHYANYDNLVLDVAKYHGVSGYVIETFAGRPLTNTLANELKKSNYGASAAAIKHYNSMKYVSIDCRKLKLPKVNLTNYLFFLNKNTSNQYKDSSFKNISNRLISLKKKVPYGYWMAIKHAMFRSRFSFYNVHSDVSALLENIKHVKSLSKFYNSVSVDFDPSRKCVFYALHFEPEASITVRARLRNQLTIIKMLSQSLPSDWVLYVKEHPDQFKLNKPGFWFFLITVHKFRTNQFYKEILKFKNVKLLNFRIKSRDIINQSEAVASINGTIALEAIVLNRPLILFGHQSTPIGLCNDALKVTSLQHCVDALSKISKGYVPQYSDFSELIDNYTFELNDVHPLRAQLLVEYLVCEYGVKQVRVG